MFFVQFCELVLIKKYGQHLLTSLLNKCSFLVKSGLKMKQNHEIDKTRRGFIVLRYCIMDRYLAPMDFNTCMRSTHPKPFEHILHTRGKIDCWILKICIKISIKIEDVKFEVMVKTFFKNRYRLKRWPKVWVLNPQHQNFHWWPLELEFCIFSKKCIPYQFCEGTHFEHSGYHKDVKSMDIKKSVLQYFRLVKIHTFSYSTHKNQIRICWDQLAEKISPNFSLVGIIFY